MNINLYNFKEELFYIFQKDMCMDLQFKLQTEFQKKEWSLCL